MATLRVLVIGGGIGGLCLAQALKRAGIHVGVYERNAQNVWPEGYRIHINPVGSQALHECLPQTLWEAFVASAGKPPAGLGFLTPDLSELVVIAEEFMANRGANSTAAHYPINRVTLRHLLLAGLDDIIHYNKRFERYTQAADGTVTAYFSDGTQATGDLLVAADGANSTVRRQYLPHAQRVELGVIGVGGKIPLTAHNRAWLPQQLRARLNLIMPSRPYTLFTAVFDQEQPSPEAWERICEKAGLAGLDPAVLVDNSQGYILWAYIAPGDSFPLGANSPGGAALQRYIGEQIRTWHPDLRRLVAESDPASISFNPFKSSLPVAAWESSNVTLLGDSIHNMPPVGGLGGNMALRDASLLARKLIAVQRGEQALLAAIQSYEAEMREYGFAALRAAIGHTHQAVSRNRVARAGANAWFRLCKYVPPLKQIFEDTWTEHMLNRPARAVI